jgi:chromosome segregation protein
MQLKKIRLGGFKSFVDPTTVTFPSQLVGVVGPNGCGKSNIIDAVRWVMGESSAKNLRGDALADVIFNGSSSRKPVGQAMIELVFDNSAGRLGGQYAQYAEISIKRQLSRDGQSVYFLNGTRCRRRDITDVFLGTGLGPRSYAIIEQGTVSRLIEAKPEELRVFLEEAAGISKYKERRRETESRIRDTRDNLNRLNDLVSELEKRLQTLQRQARAAERYRELKEEERLLKAQLLALRVRGLDDELAGKERAIAAQDIAVEKAIAALRAVETGIEARRAEQLDANEQFNRVQAEFYDLGSRITRVEQSIQHARERQQKNQSDLAELERAREEARRHLAQDREQIVELERVLADGEPEFRRCEQAEQASTGALADAEQAVTVWQGEWDVYQREASERNRGIEVERTRILHLEGHLQGLRERLSRLEAEERGLAAETGDAAFGGDLETRAAAIQDTLESLRHEQEGLIVRIAAQRESRARAAETLDAQRRQQQEIEKQHASLAAVQQVALGKQSSSVSAWLEARGLSAARRLAEDLEVESGWERAIETVLGPDLEAVCIASSEELARQLEALDDGSLAVFDTTAAAARASGTLAAPITAKVRAPWPLDGLLYGIYATDTIAEALALRPRLQAHESVITRGGVWIGAGWLRVVNASDGKAGVLAREQSLRELAQTLEQAGAAVGELERQLAAAGDELAALEQAREDCRRRLDEAGQQQAEVRAQLSRRDASLEQIERRRESIGTESADIRGQQARDEAGLAEARASLERLSADAAAHEQHHQALLRRRDELNAALGERRRQAQADRQAMRDVAVRMESARSRLSALQAGLERTERQLTQLDRQHDELRSQLAGSEQPISDLKDELERLLAQRLEVENRLADARRRLEDCEHALRELDERRGTAELDVQEQRSRLEDLRMSRQETAVLKRTLLEQIDESGHELQALLDAMPAGADASGWQERLADIDQKISRMGAINLAAIDEYREQSERKTYLDAQLADVSEALATLENAIRKIDHETRARFRETFDLVNEHMQNLYPKLFGGGVAQLEMTSDDLLEAGVTVMARPPGKRNVNIHQLSGGEKALTAVALVFAMFELNPAPFCMLDEVDAPLDDTNAARFCNLVREMSDRVQFIVITHNKITMELANQLIGVTMHEPGVSRMVAVDVDEAVEMAVG